VSATRRPLSRIGVGVIGFGWMGQAHSRSCRRIPTLFEDRGFDPELVVCADTVPTRAETALSSYGFRETTDDWRKVVDHDDVDVVFITAPNMLHEEIAMAAAAAGRHIFCEKPVGGTPEQTARIELAARRAGCITGVGYNYRWAPLVLHARQLIADGRLGRITNYRGRFFSMYGTDPLGVLSWRFLQDEAGYGVSTDLLSHAIDLAHHLVGPIAEVVGDRATFIARRPLPNPAAGTHYDRGTPGDPTGDVTNEDWTGMLALFANGARGCFEASRSTVGPQSQMAFDVYGTDGAISWNLETMNEMQLYLKGEEVHDGYLTVYAGDRHPYHGRFVPGGANAIGYEDLKVIEAYEFLSAVHRGRQHRPGFAEAVDYVSVQAALVRSWESRAWEQVRSVRL
jgi:predicted dehydrogenase